MHALTKMNIWLFLYSVGIKFVQTGYIEYVDIVNINYIYYVVEGNEGGGWVCVDKS